jgi:hypothetical protein
VLVLIVEKGYDVGSLRNGKGSCRLGRFAILDQKAVEGVLGLAGV